MLRLLKAIAWSMGAVGNGELAVMLYTGTLTELGIVAVSVLLAMLSFSCVVCAALTAQYGKVVV